MRMGGLVEMYAGTLCLAMNIPVNALVTRGLVELAMYWLTLAATVESLQSRCHVQVVVYKLQVLSHHRQLMRGLVHMIYLIKRSVH